MSNPKKAKKTQRNSGMCSISDLFKRQNELPKKNKKLPHKNKSQIGRESIILSTADSDIDSDSDIIEIIDVEEQSDCLLKLGNMNYNERANELTQTDEMKRNKVDNNSSGSSSADIGVSADRLNSRLSLKRKSAEYRENKIILNEDVCAESKALRYDQIDCGKDDSEKGKEDDDKDGRDETHLPYYQKNFQTILNTVIEDCDFSSLFSDADHAFINSYFSLSEQARKVYVRLFGRKFKWISLSKINYPEIAENLIPSLKELSSTQLIHNEDGLTDLKDVLEILTAGDIKSMAKLYHVATSITQKKLIVQELIKLSQRSTVSSMFGAKGGVGASMMKKARTLMKGAFKLQQEPRSVFIRMMMFFSLVNTTGDEDSGNGGQGQLFQMLMVNMGKVVYPTYKMQKKSKIFKSREDVIRFEHALQLESDLLNSIEKGNWIGAYYVYCSISKELEKLQQDEEIHVWSENMPDFLRPFTATSVMYRLLSRGIEILQRRKEFTEAVTLIKRLLDQQLYCCSHRGYWWERLALNLDVHLKEPQQSLEAVAAGLEDHHVIGGHRLALFQRAESICERPRLKLKHKLSNFHHIPIKELPKVCLEGRVLHQGVTASGPRFLTEGSYANGNAQDMTVCGVEEFVMEYYKRNGYPCVPDAFHSLYQAQPLDLYSSTTFYTTRKDAIEERLAKLENSSTEELNKMIEETWTNEYGKLCVGLHWDRFQSPDEVKGLVNCMGGKALHGILGRYAKCPRHTRSGFPDLTLWNVQTGAWKICEVKGPGDKLSHKQILWLDHLLGLNVDAEVCHVKAVAAKKLRHAT